VCDKRKKEQEREKNSILFDKVAFPICFKFVSNWRGGRFTLIMSKSFTSWRERSIL
jgi:hypothetical protein